MKDKSIQGNILFKETQRFSQTWFWLLLLLPLVTTTGIMIFVLSNESDKKDALIGSLIVFPITIAVVAGFFLARFEIIVTDGGIYYRWRPFQKKYSRISPNDVRECRIRKSPFLQMGSKHMVWGYGRVHNTGAAEGVHFILHSGKKIFLSSNKVKRFFQAVEPLVNSSAS